MVFLTLATFYPFVTSLGLSFFDYNFLKVDTSFVGFKNYIDILTEGKFLSSVGFTIFWTVSNVLLTTLLGFVMAMLLRMKFWGREVLKGLLLIPWILPQVVTGYTFNLMMSQDTLSLIHI